MSNSRVVVINILHDGHRDCPHFIIDVSNENINDDAVMLVVFGLQHNTTVCKLNFSHNCISDVGAVAISKYLEGNKHIKELDISYNSICDAGAVAISKCLAGNSTLYALNLCNNNITYNGIKVILKATEKNTVLQELGISCEKLADGETMSCEDGNMFQILDAYESKVSTVESIGTLTHSEISDVEVIIESVKNNDFLTKLQVPLPLTSKYTRDKVVLSRADAVCNVSGRSIRDEEVLIVSAMLYNNKAVTKLDFSCNKICDLGAKAIADYIRSNAALKEIDLSLNRITSIGMKHLLKSVKNLSRLEYINLSGNDSSPWGVYCVIIRHSHVDSLTICGDNGMEECVDEITDSLDSNKGLEILTLCGIQNNSIKSLKKILAINTTLKAVNISWQIISTEERNDMKNSLLHTKFPIDTLSDIVSARNKNRVVDISVLYKGCCQPLSSTLDFTGEFIDPQILSLGLYSNTTVEKLNLSYSAISDDGAEAISSSLVNNIALLELDLSHNRISSRGMNCLLKSVKKYQP